MVLGHLPHCHLSPAGLWLSMLVCAMLAAAAFIAYTSQINWKLAAEEVSESATPALGHCHLANWVE